jgi:hypothetical protein
MGQTIPILVVRRQSRRFNGLLQQRSRNRTRRQLQLEWTVAETVAGRERKTRCLREQLRHATEALRQWDSLEGRALP